MLKKNLSVLDNLERKLDAGNLSHLSDYKLNNLPHVSNLKRERKCFTELLELVNNEVFGQFYRKSQKAYWLFHNNN